MDTIYDNLINENITIMFSGLSGKSYIIREIENNYRRLRFCNINAVILGNC